MQDHEETTEVTLKIGLLILSQYIHNLSSLWITSRSPSSSSPSWPPPAQSPPPWSRMREDSRSSWQQGTLQLQSFASLSHLGRGQQRTAMFTFTFTLSLSLLHFHFYTFTFTLSFSHFHFHSFTQT